MKKTLVAFLLDRSGSMDAVRQKTIDAFNEYMKGIDADGEVHMTLATFDSEGFDLLADDQPVRTISPLTAETYQPRALTPLYDSIARLIRRADGAVAKGGLGKKSQRVLFVMLTDGLENASTEMTRDQVFEMLQERQKRGWTVTYLGANQDAFAVGRALGIPVGNVADFNVQHLNRVARGMSASVNWYARTGGGYTSSLYEDALVDTDSFVGEDEDATAPKQA